MKRLVIYGVALSMLFIQPFAVHADIGADALMKSVKDRYRGDTWVTTSSVTLIDKDKNRTVRRVKSINKKSGEDQKSKTIVLSPSRLAGTTFLSYDWGESSREDEAWIFLPELARVIRLATGSRADYFLGSDFTYGDLEEIKLEHFDFSYVNDEKVAEGQVLVQADPAKEIRDKVIDRTGYQRVWHWVDREKKMVVKSKYWLKDPGWVKFYTLSEIQNIDSVWVGRREQMVLTQQGAVVHATTLTADEVMINGTVDEAQLSPQNLGRSVK